MAKKISIRDQVAKRAERRFPDYDLTIDEETGESLVFRNMIRLTKKERLAYGHAATDMQNEIADLIKKAKDADDGQEADPELLESLEEIEGTDMYVRMLKRQLVVLAEDGEKAQGILDELDDITIAAIHSIVTDGLDKEDESGE